MESDSDGITTSEMNLNKLGKGIAKKEEKYLSVLKNKSEESFLTLALCTIK